MMTIRKSDDELLLDDDDVVVVLDALRNKRLLVKCICRSAHPRLEKAGQQAPSNGSYIVPVGLVVAGAPRWTTKRAAEQAFWMPKRPRRQ